MLPHLGIGELVVLLVIVLLLFGPKRLPELAASLGKSLKAFRQGIKEGAEEKNPPDKPEP